MFRYFECLVDPFSTERAHRPPARLFAYYRHYVGQAWRPFAVALIASGLAAVTNAMVYVCLGLVIDLLERTPDPATVFGDNAGLFGWIAFLLLVASPALALVVLGIFNQTMAPAFTTLVRWQTHRYVLGQSVGYFQNDFAGRIANKAMHSAQAVRRSVREVIDALWQATIFVVTTLIVLASVDIRLVAPLLVWLSVYVAILIVFVPRIAAASTLACEAFSSLSGRVVDGYSNILTVKAFGRASLEDAQARDSFAHLQRLSSRLMRNLTAVDLAINVLNASMILGLGALALWLWSIDDVTIGMVAAALALALRINQMSYWIMFVSTSVAESVGVVRDAIDTLSVPQRVADVEGAMPLRVPRGEVRFEGVVFRYTKGHGRAGGAVINDLTLTVAPGERVGLVGRSGAGKSTLVHLLLRLHDLEAGRILIDGQDIARVNQDSLRASIGVVTQDTSLLHRSVLDNIRYGRPTASLEEVVAAARRAQAHDFIVDLTDPNGRRGYDAHVGEHGVQLSGGQRQRIAIARVLLKNAPILVLDEATSALDSRMETAIQEQLFDLMSGKTAIVIAHRLSTIAAMDRLVVMDRGRIVDEGTHQALFGSGRG